MPPKRRGNPKAASLSSRKPSTAATTNPLSQKDDNSVEGPAAPGTYQEPPVLNLPSYEEYKGIPRSMVLADMQPLGAFPTNTVKLRVKPPKRTEAFRPPVRARKPGKSTAKEQVESAESSQPLVTPQSIEPFHPMITRKRTQSHNTQGETQSSSRPASRLPQDPISRPHSSASRKPKDTNPPNRRSASRKPNDPIPQTRRSASRKPQGSAPSTRSVSRKPQDPVSSARRSESRKPQDLVSQSRRSVSRKPRDPTSLTGRSESLNTTGRKRRAESLHPTSRKRRSQSRNVEDRASVTRRSQSRQLENQNPITHRSQSLTLEDQIPQESSSREKKDGQNNMPKGVVETSSKAVPPPPSAYSGPSSRTSAGQIRLKQVVDAAVQRSIDLGNPVIGLAIKKLYEDSLNDRTLADLLDGVLSQEPTAQQTIDFQAFIKVARKQIKVETGSARHSSQSTRPSSSRHTGAPQASSDVLGKRKLPSKVDDLSSLPQDTITATEDVSTKEGNPPKRRKTSRSISTSSSLSSLPSNDHELSPIAKGDQANVIQTTIKPLTVEQSPLVSKPNRPSDLPKPYDVSPEAPIENLSDQERELLEKRKTWKRNFPQVEPMESNIRDEPRSIKRHRVQSVKSKPAFILTQPRPPIAASLKRKQDDEDSIHSLTSSHGELLIPPPPGARASSRGTTPNPTGRPTKRTKTARVKMSPEKKKKTGVAATGRTGGRKGAKSIYAEEVEVDNNEDACSACGGNGKLLCCDNCPSAFHFSCTDPPLDEDNPPEGEWLCNKCEGKRDHSATKSGGLFSGLVENIEKRGPSVFSLPRELRDKYEGVRTGDTGEYQEYTQAGTKTKAKTYDEARAESLKLKDKVGKTIVCYSCRQSALGGRQMTSCDYCPLKWHLDCLDPPRAALPVKQPSGDPRHTWMCPNHVDHELRAIDLSIRAAGEPNPAGKLFKLRKPKNARVIEPAITRGLRNDGLIDIINDPSDEEVDSIYRSPAIYRLTEKSIKLDFIDKLKKTNEEEARRKARGGAAVNEAFDNHSFIDRQAALNLAQFAMANQDLGLSPANVGDLTHALIAEAPANVVSLITREEKSTRLSTIPEEESTDAPVRLAPSSPSAEKSIGGTEKQTLELLQELIRRRLEAVASSR